MFSPYGAFHYLPLRQGNTWTFGCAGSRPGDALEGVWHEFSVVEILCIGHRPVWVLSQKVSSDQSETPTYGPDTYYVLDDDIIYSATSLEAIADLPDSRDALTAFVHTDLTPRTIEDETDPLRKRYAAPVRYVAGRLTDFLPISFVREPSDGGEPVAGMVEAEDFGEHVRNLDDCIALEVNKAAAGQEPLWVPALILGRGIGPVLVEDGGGGYISLERAFINGREY